MTEQEFAAAVLAPGLCVPAGLVDAQGRPAGKRFSVYRNNVVSGLIRVLEAGLPVVRKLVSDAFFSAMAAEFVRAHPPKSRIMMLYGSRFPEFLKTFPPVTHLGYLADVAKLELALRQSYYATDSTGIAPDRLSNLAPDAFATVHVRLAPSVILLQSDWPIFSIWRANTSDNHPVPVMRAEDVVILRPEYDPVPHLLPKGGAAFLLALQSGNTLATAIESCPSVPDELNDLIQLLLKSHAIIDIEGEFI